MKIKNFLIMMKNNVHTFHIDLKYYNLINYIVVKTWKVVEVVESVLSFHMFPHDFLDNILKVSFVEMWKIKHRF